VGYDEGRNYRIWFPLTNEVVKSAQVKFDETPRDQRISYVDTVHSPLPHHEDTVELEFPTVDTPIEAADVIDQPQLDDSTAGAIVPFGQDDPEDDDANLFKGPPEVLPPWSPTQEPTGDIDPPPRRRSDRVNKGVPPSRLGHVQQMSAEFPLTVLYNYAAAIFAHPGQAPRTHKDVLRHPLKEKWIKAEHRELCQLAKLKVACLVPLPKGARLIPSKWAYEVKQNGNLKARFVARGDKERPGTNFQETFASVVLPETLRVLLAITAIENREAHCVDIMTAFLHTLLPSEQPIFLRPPQAYETYDSSG
jgi:hypothetical protein